MKKGVIVRISGPVIDVKFDTHLPKLNEALYVEVNGEKRVMEVAKHVEEGLVRCIILAESDGLSRGMEVLAPGTGIQVPVGDCSLGRMFNVLGNPIDEKGRKCIESWERFCPGYEVKHWDESNFDLDSYPFAKKAYEQKKWAFVSDVANAKVQSPRP